MLYLHFFIKIFLTFFISLVFIGCSSDEVTDESVAPTSANSFIFASIVLPSENNSTLELIQQSCENVDGFALYTGFDQNDNNILDESEYVGDPKIICNGSNGEDGISALAIVEELSVGDSTCSNGGSIIKTGIDTDNNKILSIDEVEFSSYVCNAQDTNTSIQTTVVTLTQLNDANTNCFTGGIQIDTGVDSDSNGLLSDSETLATSYVCNGVDGTDGVAGLDGMDGIDGTSGTGGLTALVRIDELSLESIECPASGIAIYNGIDINANGVLDSAEQNTTYQIICNGVSAADGLNGVDGTDGVDGSDGLTTLIRTNSFDGALNGCESGGITIEVGLDSNKDGVLTTEEVDTTQTKYLCHNLDLPISFSFIDIIDVSVYNSNDFSVPLEIVEGNETVSITVEVTNNDENIVTLSDFNNSRLLFTPLANSFGTVDVSVRASDSQNSITKEFTITVLKPVPKTGKSSIYDFDDGWYKRGVERNYSYYTNAIVVDNLNGQMWTNLGNGTCVTNACDGGLKAGSSCTTDSDCLNSINLELYSLTTQAEAASVCEGLSLDGFSDWILPEVKKLQELMNGGLPSLFNTYNKNDGISIYLGHSIFMSNKILSETNTPIQVIENGHATTSIIPLAQIPEISIMCTRNQPTNSDTVSYEVTSDNLLLDKATGLMWTDEHIIDSTSLEGYLQYCQDFNTFNYNDWRLPNLNEALSIEDFSFFTSNYNLSVSDYIYTSSAVDYNTVYFSSSDEFLVKSTKDDRTLISAELSFLSNPTVGLRCVRGGEKAGLGPIYSSGLVGDATCIFGSSIDLGTPIFYQPDDVEIAQTQVNEIASPFTCDTLGDYIYSASATDVEGNEGISPEFTITVNRDSPTYVEPALLVEALLCIMGETITLPLPEFTHSDPEAIIDINLSLENPYLCEDTPENNEGYNVNYFATATDQYGMTSSTPEFEIWITNPRPVYIGGIIEENAGCMQNETIDLSSLVDSPSGDVDFSSPLGNEIVDINYSITFPFDCNRTAGVYTYHATATDSEGYVGVSHDMSITVYSTEPIYIGGLVEEGDCQAINNPISVGTPTFWMPAGVSLVSQELYSINTPAGSSVMEINCTKGEDTTYYVLATFSNGSEVVTPAFSQFGFNSPPQYESGLNDVICRSDEGQTRTAIFSDADAEPLSYEIDPLTGVSMVDNEVSISCLEILGTNNSLNVTASDGEEPVTQALSVSSYYQDGLIGDETCKADSLPKALGTPNFLLPDGVTLTSTELYVSDVSVGTTFELTSCVKDEEQTYYAVATYSDSSTARSPEYTVTGVNSPPTYVSGVSDVICISDELHNMIIITEDIDNDTVYVDVGTFDGTDIFPVSGVTIIDNNLTVDCTGVASSSTIDVVATDLSGFIEVTNFTITK